MRLTVFNGSPRGQRSNTKFLLDKFIEGYASVPGNTYELMYLSDPNHSELRYQFFEDAEIVLVAFPLYVDSMPSMVKAFFESLQPLCGRADNPAIFFLVQSGFPESVHSQYIERYLERLAARLGSKYLGTIIRGMTEGIQSRSPKANTVVFTNFYNLGKYFGETGQLNNEITHRLRQPVKFEGFALFILTIVGKFGLFNKGWDQQLKENNAYDQRSDRPFED